MFPIGIHIQKKRTLSATLKTISDFTRPYQFFFMSRSTRINIKDGDIEETRKIIDDKNALIYVHTPYLLNLASLPPDHPDNYTLRCLIDHLHIGTQMGLKGVVIHVGKSVKLSKSEALDNMRANLVVALKEASYDCPILLETPSGQGTDLLGDVTEFIKFIATLPNLGICIDTCHVFAAGYMPFDYITTVHSSCTIGLIHFNDSKTPLGSHTDRHACPGHGYIPKEDLLSGALFAETNKIPMLSET
jgi:deoxyribonuclease-4